MDHSARENPPPWGWAPSKGQLPLWGPEWSCAPQVLRCSEKRLPCPGVKLALPGPARGTAEPQVSWGLILALLSFRLLLYLHRQDFPKGMPVCLHHRQTVDHREQKAGGNVQWRRELAREGTVGRGGRS